MLPGVAQLIAASRRRGGVGVEQPVLGVSVAEAAKHVRRDAVVTHGRRVLGGVWGAVVELDTGSVLAVDGSAPADPWLAAMVGRMFEVAIPAFSLDVPGERRVLN